MAISFNQARGERDPSSWLIVDALNLAFRYKHGKVRDFGNHYLTTVESLAKSYSCGTIIIVCDKGSSTYRKEIHPGYKGARKEKYENQSEEEKAEAEQFFQDFESALEILRTRYPVARYPGVEADDLAACIVEEGSYGQAWLVSSDKDWDLLIDERTSRFSYVTRKEVTVDNFEEVYEVPIESYTTYKCLMGDTGDSIPGVKGIGPKRAASLIADYGDIDTIIKTLPIQSKYKYIQELNAAKELLETNVKLMDLRKHYKDAIGEHYEDFRKLWK